MTVEERVPSGLLVKWHNLGTHAIFIPLQPGGNIAKFYLFPILCVILETPYYSYFITLLYIIIIITIKNIAVTITNGQE